MLSNPMDNTTLKRRKQQAGTPLKVRESAFGTSLDKIPSFTGKARFMDQVKRAQTHAHNLHWDLERDAGNSPKIAFAAGQSLPYIPKWLASSRTLIAVC